MSNVRKWEEDHAVDGDEPARKRVKRETDPAVASMVSSSGMVAERIKGYVWPPNHWGGPGQ